jgi:hypothetical protein
VARVKLPNWKGAEGSRRYRIPDRFVEEGAGLDGVESHKERKVVLFFIHPLSRPLETQDRVHRPCRVGRHVIIQQVL